MASAASTRGELRSDLDPDTAIDALWGAVYYGLLVSHATTETRWSRQTLSLLEQAVSEGFASTSARSM